MALIRCKDCGNMVSSRAESCPKCGFSVRLSMEQQEEANQPVTPPVAPASNTMEQQEETNQPETPPLDEESGRSSKKGLIAVIVAVVIIVCGGIGWMVYNGNLGKQDTRIVFLSWIQGNWRCNTPDGEIEIRLDISDDYIAVFSDGCPVYTGTYTIEGTHIVYDKHDGYSSYVIIDAANQRLMMDEQTPMQRFENSSSGHLQQIGVQIKKQLSILHRMLCPM